MPINLLTGEVKQVAKDKPVNLLPDLTTELFIDKEKLPGIKRDIDVGSISAAPPERPTTKFLKKVAEFVGIRKTFGEQVAEAQIIYADATTLSKEKDIPIGNAIRFERQKRESDVVGAIKVFGSALVNVPGELKNTVLKSWQGAEGASVTDSEGIQETLRNAKVDSNKFVQDVWDRYGERKIFPGIPIKITDVAQLPQSLAFSLTSMGAGLATGVPIAFAPIPGARIVAWGMGTAVSGKVAFEMSTYEIMQEYLEAKNEAKILELGRGITVEEEKKLKADFNSAARKFGLWEAVPEALSNLAFAKLLTAPLAKMVGKRLAGRIIARMAGIYGEELITETITEKGQSAIMQKAGLEPAGEPITWMEAFKRIAPQTFLLSTILAGTGAIVVKSKQKIIKSLNREVGKEHPKYKQLLKDIDRLVEKQKLPDEVVEEKVAPEVKLPGEAEITPEQLKEGFVPVEKEAKITPEEVIAEIEKVPEIIKEPQIVSDLKEITEKINTLRSEGKAVPDSLIKRQQAIIKSFEGGEVIDIKKAPPSVQKILGIEPSKFVQVRETTLLKQRLKDIAKGAREGKTFARKEIKSVQDSVIKLFKEAKLDIPVSIKEIQTQEQLTKALPTIRETIARLEEAVGKREAQESIKKELKSTKPVKKGQRRVGKFDPESNRLFDEIRGFNKLNQAQAQAEFDKFPEEVTNEVDLIKKRFLSLKANGATASTEIHNQVLADIQRIKALGKLAKDQADLEKKLNRQEIVDDALASIGRSKADKKTVKTKIGNVYRKGFSNLYSMLNSIGGKLFAETHDPKLNESRRNTATYKKTLEVTLAASKIYDESNIMRLFETMSQKDYQITDLEGLTTELSKLELIDIYNSIKNEKKQADYYEAFSKGQVETLMMKLTPNDKAFGDMLQEAVQDYREILNKRNIEITGRDLGFIVSYWPATSEFMVSVLDDIRVQGETPSALKERAKGRVIPIPTNAWYKAQRHFAQGEHVANLSREFEALKRLFNDRKVKHAVKQKFGDDVYNTMITQIDNISLNKQTEKIDAISSIFQKAINNWVTAKIALNPSTYVRQLMSMGNYAEKMNSAEWVSGFFKGISSPKQTFEFMWKNAPFLEARFNKGFSEALKEAIEGAESISVNKSNYTKFLTALVRSGDITAIVYGGFPLVQSEIAKGKAAGLSDKQAMKRAIKIFENATLESQQSGLSSAVSEFQNSRNPFTRLFLAFKNTSNQYFRKMIDNVITFQNGDISAGQFAKTMAIYAVIQPIMYVSAGFATKQGFGLLGRLFFGKKDDEDFEEQAEKLLNDIMIQLIVSPVNAIPVIDDVARTAARKLLGQKVYKVFSTPLFDDLERGFRSLTKKDISGGDYLKVMTSILEPTTALPIATGIRFFETLTGKKIGGKAKSKAPAI